ncbi:hypothetical protein DENIS_0578 [Desulfonema ishimotonii]|uniref:G8 domain-containing protein n=1 Tax=Desulfonema ishimotonii TaxID=45657 RepID=A0A401FRP3_9BACT|nr:hypothetical protein DENIS_0578 [Desulfonema ishimotonii]
MTHFIKKRFPHVHQIKLAAFFLLLLFSAANLFASTAECACDVSLSFGNAGCGSGEGVHIEIKEIRGRCHVCENGICQEIDCNGTTDIGSGTVECLTGECTYTFQINEGEPETGSFKCNFANGNTGANASVRGVKFNDLNANMIMDGNEQTLANHNVLIRNTDTKDFLTTKTDANGRYIFTGLSAGWYDIWSGIPTDWCQTAPVWGAGLVVHSMEIADKQGITVNFGITTNCGYSDGDGNVPETVTVSGYIRTGACTPIEGVELQGFNGNPVTDSNGFYTARLPAGWTGTVMPVAEGYAFYPPRREYRAVLADLTEHDYSDTRMYELSGQIHDAAGNPVKNVTLGELPGVRTDENGAYRVLVPSGWSGTVTPESPLYLFEPASLHYGGITENTTGQNYTSELPTYTISGYIRDSEGNSVPGVVLEGVPGRRSTDWRGFYIVTVEFSQILTLTPRKPGYTFSPSDSNFTDITGNITNAGFSARLATGTNCELSTRTIQSAKSGNWSDPATWTAGRVPGADDSIQINEGDMVIVDVSEVRVSSICNYGVLKSEAGRSVNLRVGDFLYNSGRISGADGLSRGQAGSAITLNAENTIYNAEYAEITGGNGANDNSYHARGAQGGMVSLFSAKIINRGHIAGGKGGEAYSCCAGGSAYGGPGGDIILLAREILVNMPGASGSNRNGVSSAICCYRNSHNGLMRY